MLRKDPSKLLASGLWRCILPLCVVAGLSAPLGAQQRGEGPTSLIVTYKAQPAHRAALRAYMSGPGLAQFERWKAEGVFADYQLFFSSYVNSELWDMLALLSFDRYTDTARWRDVEKSMPGGLSAEALAMGVPIATQLADLTWQKAASIRDRRQAVYFFIPYEYANLGSYKNYVGAYVTPQLDAWVREDVLSHYGIYLNQHPTGAVWDALFVLEYRDLAAFSQRDVLKWKIREGLAQQPGWKTISDIKHDFRSEGAVNIAEALLPR